MDPPSFLPDHCSHPGIETEGRVRDRLKGHPLVQGRALSTTLFDRSTCTRALTEAGVVLLDEARALHTAAGTFVARAHRLTDARAR